MRLSLGVASFQMLSKHLMRCQDLVLLQEKTNNRQGLWWFLFTDKHGFRTLELRTTKALLSLMSIQQSYFCSFCWSAGPLPALPLLVCLSAMHCASVWMGVWTSLGECVDLTAPGIWFAVVADFFWELHAFFPKAAELRRELHLALVTCFWSMGSPCAEPSLLLREAELTPRHCHLISALLSPAFGNWKYLLCVGSTKPSK